jgi:putative sugar O-methyltransferase
MNNSSKLWDKYTTQEFGNISDEFLTDFRAPGSANKFVAWDPYERSTRYLKFLLLAVIQKQSDDFFESYKKITNCNFGNPLSIRCRNLSINSDYLAAIEEWLFMTKFSKLNNVTNVVEIGAGFGRTCHTLLTLCPNIKNYTIVDLDQMLNLSRCYLQKVAPHLIDRVRFVSNHDLAAQELLKPDLVINIDSFQEMPPSVIDGYMQRIIGKADLFFCKNPVGKYLPQTVGLPPLEPEQALDVFKLGRCTAVIDIFDEEALQESRVHYLSAYSPSDFSDRKYEVVGTKPMDLFPYFHLAMYKRYQVEVC